MLYLCYIKTYRQFVFVCHVWLSMYLASLYYIINITDIDIDKVQCKIYIYIFSYLFIHKMALKFNAYSIPKRL